MKKRMMVSWSTVGLCLLGAAATAQAPREQTDRPTSGDAADAAFADMRNTLGIVPSFVRLLPRAGVAGAWQEWKALELGSTAIPARYKNLISLGVSGQIPCTHCTYYDTQIARAAGATPQELSEAVTMAALTRKWSTVLNGHMQDEVAFRKEADAIFAHARRGGAIPSITVTDHTSALRDIEQTLGTVPSFMKAYPPAALPGAWMEFKNVQLAPNTALPPRYKELIGLAVAAQIPCRYCVYFHAQAAQANGATQPELDEAIALAALTRHWGTLLSGLQVDERTFRREVDEMAKRMRPAPARAQGPKQTPTSTAPVR
jgi:AhpD family alkylhydroperoxidase